MFQSSAAPLSIGQDGSCEWMIGQNMSTPSGQPMVEMSQAASGSSAMLGGNEGLAGYVSVSVPFIQIPAAPCTLSELDDHQIIEGLAASSRTHMRLLQTAHGVRELLYNIIPVHRHQDVWVELYGSLALYGPQQGVQKNWHQDWAQHYVRVNSDIDLVVLLQDGAMATEVVNRLVQHEWKLQNMTNVPKFAITQFTFSGNSEQFWLDMTCIDKVDHYNRFKRRQEAFMYTFKMVRASLEGAFGRNGALAFDAYIYLLKAFAHSLPSNIITSFQATCFGLFCLQLKLYELKCVEPTGLMLFECFLRFCSTFFDGSMEKAAMMRNYRYNVVDLSLGARMLPRTSRKWQCEAYFLSCEVGLQTNPSERVNIAHSIDPAAVCKAARVTLMKKAVVEDGVIKWQASTPRQ